MLRDTGRQVEPPIRKWPVHQIKVEKIILKAMRHLFLRDGPMIPEKERSSFYRLLLVKARDELFKSSSRWYLG
jgi:hypothetical protein